MKPTAVFRATGPRCMTCGGHHTTPAPYINPAERLAVERGWSLGEFRAATLQLASYRITTDDLPIPPAPDQHRLIASRGVSGTVSRGRIDPPADVRTNRAGADEAIPAAPDQHERIRAQRADAR